MLFATTLCGAGVASAQTRIGAATLVENDVRAERRGGPVPLVTGGSVFRAEAVATGASSSARLTFLDSTNLAIGPASRIVLDEFVFSPSPTSQTLTINLARGAFRFSTGSFDKNAYKIRTPTATIGVRGTVLDISSQAGRTLVTLVDNGAALVCVGNSNRCESLTIAGQTLIVERSGIRTAQQPALRFSFQQYCTGSPGLCAQSRLAQSSDDAFVPSVSLPAALASDQQPSAADQPCGGGACLSPKLGVAGLTGVGRYSDGSQTISFPFNTGLFPAGSASEIGAAFGSNGTFSDGQNSVTTSGSITLSPASSQGYQYTSWGEWSGNVQIAVTTSSGSQSVSLDRGQYVYGSLTPSDVVANLRGGATYSGTVRGDYIASSGSAVAGGIGGSIALNADFTSRTVSGSLALTRGGQSWSAPVFSSVPLTLGIYGGSGAGFNGSLTGTSGSSVTGFGLIGGAFAGPNAEEALGTFTYVRSTGSSSDGLAAGVFQARK